MGTTTDISPTISDTIQGENIGEQNLTHNLEDEISMMDKTAKNPFTAKGKKQSNSLKRIYSDSNCSYDSDNISSYENNSNCISVSSGSSGSQRRLKEGDFLGSNVAQNENGN